MQPIIGFCVAVFISTAALTTVTYAASACLSPIEIHHAKVIRVEKNGVIVLSDGRAARLEGILLPAGASDHAPRSFADAAIAEVADLALDHSLALAATPPKEDRYGRIRAQVVAAGKREDIWLQQEMLRKGLARVAIAPDRDECSEELYAAEARARADRIGIWSTDAYAVRRPTQLENEIGTFEIVQGIVHGVSSSGGRTYLDFGADSHSGFAAMISSEDLKRFREIGVDPFAYKNATVRVHGWVDTFGHRPVITVATPQQLEVLNAAEAWGTTAPGE